MSKLETKVIAGISTLAGASPVLLRDENYPDLDLVLEMGVAFSLTYAGLYALNLGYKIWKSSNSYEENRSRVHPDANIFDRFRGGGYKPAFEGDPRVETNPNYSENMPETRKWTLSTSALNNILK